MMEQLGLRKYEGEDSEAYQRFIDNAKRLNEEKFGTRENWTQSPNRYRASSMCYPCMRRAMLAAKYPQEFPDKTVGLFRVGDIVHEELQALYPECEGEFPVEYNVNDGDNILFTITGHPDLVDYDRSVCRDFKSWGWLTGIRKEPKWTHIRQIMFYMGALGLDEGAVIYVQKQDFDMVEWWFDYSQEVFDQIVKDGMALYNAYQTNTIPIDKTGDYCGYCQGKKRCREIRKYGSVVQEVEI